LDVKVKLSPRWRKRTGYKKEEFGGTTLVRLVDIATKGACQELERAIRRHCDGVEQVQAYPQVTQEVCEYCQAPWTTAGNFYNGGCCDEDEEHNPMPLLGRGAGQETERP
jgi:hypothetical protein